MSEGVQHPNHSEDVSTFPSAASIYGEFPIRDDISIGESGHGYVLRMAAANYLNGLPAVKKMLGKTRFAVLDCGDAPLLSQWFGADLQKLERALGATGIGRTESEFEICGQVLARSYFVNRMHPRVCPLCLEKAPYCRSHWEISLVTACHLHGFLLEDKCRWCGASMSWNRPSVTICKCGMALLGDAEYSPCTPLEGHVSLWVSTQVADRVPASAASTFSSPLEFEASEVSLIRLLEPLTLGGGLQMIYALGTAERSDTSSSHEVIIKKSSLRSARDVICNAAAMVERLMASEHVEFRRSNLSVVVNLLAESAKASSDSADRSLAHSLIYVLLRQGGRSNWKSKYPQLSQYELF